MKISYLMALILLLSCQEIKVKRGTLNNEKHNGLRLTIYNDVLKSVQTKYPNNWKIIDDKESLFAAQSQINRNNHIGIVAVEKQEFNINLSDYVLEMYNGIKELGEINKSISLINYIGTELNFNKNAAYYSVVNSIQSDKQIIVMAFYVDAVGKIFDFKYRFEFNDNMEETEKIFWEIIYSFKYNAKPLVLQDDFEIVRPSPLAFP